MDQKKIVDARKTLDEALDVHVAAQLTLDEMKEHESTARNNRSVAENRAADAESKLRAAQNALNTALGVRSPA